MLLRGTWAGMWLKMRNMPLTRQRQQAAGSVKICGNHGAGLVLVLVLGTCRQREAS